MVGRWHDDHVRLIWLVHTISAKMITVTGLLFSN